MSAIAPNGEVRFLRGVHLDKSYNHTYRFSNVTEQMNYFNTFVKPNMIGRQGETISFKLTNQNYQRVDKGIIRVGIGCDYLYDVNYMMFKNNIFNVNKWFYAFVDEVRYVNNGTSDIVYTIDVMQSWKFDYELGECFVEREHTESDKIGEHIVSENIEVGDYTVIKNEKYGTDETSCLIIGTDNIDSKITNYGGVFNGVYTGLQIDVVNRATIPTLETDEDWGNRISASIQSVFSNQGAIAGVFMIPKYLGDLYNRTLDGNVYIRTLDEEWDIYLINHFVDEHGNEYTPINNKLLTYPYHIGEIVNYAGQSQQLKFENFTTTFSSQNSWVKFKIEGCIQPTPVVAITPMLYNTENISRLNTIILSDFIDCNYVIDSFTSYWNTNKYKFMYSTISNAISVGAGVALSGSGNVSVSSSGEKMTSQGVQGLAKNLVTYAQQKAIPDTIKSNLNTDAIKVITNTYGFGFYEKGIKPQYAKIIDDYFNMYGYAINEVKKPQTTSRPYWNYIKTNGCIVHAVENKGLPAEAENLISQIYDNGITFWNSDVEIGDYSLAPQNRPQ